MKLKLKSTILAISIFCLTGNLSAQLTTGFQVGLNIAGLHGHKDYDENKLRIGLAANLTVDIPLDHSGFISLETGIGIAQHGMNHTRITDSLASITTTKVKNKLDYMVMPIYLKENFTNAYTKIGVYGGYLLNVKSDWTSVQEIAGIAQPELSGTNDDFVSNANVYDYGLSFGFGFITYLNQGRRIKRRRGKRMVPILQVDFKYNIGLAKIDAVGNTPDMNYKNRAFLIGLTISSVPNR